MIKSSMQIGLFSYQRGSAGQLQQKVWVYKDIDENEVDKLAVSAGISRLLAKVFVSRGIIDSDYVKDFLKPDIGLMHDPFLMDGMERAADRIVQAVSNGEAILVYGDYDVDGVTSTSILYNFLISQGAKMQYYIPDRMEDGYGLTMTAVEKVKGLNASLMITVDCGITSADEVCCMQDSGMQVIITDHHACKELLPDAFAVLNPHKPGCGYPFKELAGAGVVLKLVQALCIKLNCNSEYTKYLDLAALATIADVVPLLDENRIIASLGLKAMETTKNQGLRALIKVAGLGGKLLTSYGAAFGLAPRVNAAGRLGSANRGVRLFTTDSQALAEALAKELDGENKSRQDTENEIIVDAIKFVEEQIDLEREKVLVVSGEGWHHGVIGIVASKLLEKFNRPCIVISVENGVGKGSGRSLKCFNLFKALSLCEELMDRFGGHEMAAGLTIQADKIDVFRTRINEYADSILTDIDLLPCIRVDAFLDRTDVALENAHELAQMAPFGACNPGPVFGYTAFYIAGIRTLSAGKHLKFRLADGSLVVEAIGFNMGELADEYVTGDALDVIFSLEVNSWNGTDSLQLNLRDAKACIYMALDKNIVFGKVNDYNRYNNCLQELYSLQGHYNLKAAVLVPERCELEAVYRHMRACDRLQQSHSGSADSADNGVNGRNGENGENAGNSRNKGKRLEFADLFVLSALISEKYSVNINFFKLKRSLEIFQELGLLLLESVGQKGVAVLLTPGMQKVELEASQLFSELQDLNKHYS